jgi:hypothetical protein
MSSSLIDAVRPNPPAGLDVPDQLSEDEQQNLLHALTAVADPRHRRGMRYPVGLAKSVRLRCLRILVDQPAQDRPLGRPAELRARDWVGVNRCYEDVIATAGIVMTAATGIAASPASGSRPLTAVRLEPPPAAPLLPPHSFAAPRPCQASTDSSRGDFRRP